jgi:amidophosphoribosyltransferase
MCGLVGIINKKDDSRTMFENRQIRDSFIDMTKTANSRGGHSTGFAIVQRDGDYLLIKRNKNAFLFFLEESVQNALDFIDNGTSAIIGHTRYSTQGSPKFNENNHPIRANNTIGTHNGSVWNDDELFDKFGLERFAEVDSEVLFRLYDYSDNFKDFVDKLKLVKGRVSMVWQDLEFPEYVYLFKGNNPLEIAYVPSLKCLAYGSTREIVKSGFSNELRWIEIKPNTLVRVNTNTLKWFKVDARISESESSYFTFDSKIGASVRKPNPHKPKKPYTPPTFIPRYTSRDRLEDILERDLPQQDLPFQTRESVVTRDGSKIKKIK